MFGAAAMSLSSFCVVTNALRLNLFSVHGKANKDAAPAAEPVEIKTSESEEKVMTKTMHIEGMMCGHCEATVKKMCIRDSSTPKYLPNNMLREFFAEMKWLL